MDHSKTSVIDLSHHNDVQSFDALKELGIFGVIHKVSEDTNYTDPTYDTRRQMAADAGLLWGGYHFLRPGDLVAQADWFINAAKPDAHTLLAADHEDTAVSLDDLKAFLLRVEERTGQKAAIYSGHVLKEQVGDTHDAMLAEHRLWLAQYSTTPSWPSNTWESWWLWQFSDTGTVTGINGHVDVNAYCQTPYDRIEWARSGKAGTMRLHRRY